MNLHRSRRCAGGRLAVVSLLVWFGSAQLGTAVAAPRVPTTYEQLLDYAEAVAVVSITAVDRHEVAYDGPAWVQARILKNLDGSLPDGEELSFTSTGSFRASLPGRGETRIVFLISFPAPAPSSSQWSAMIITGGGSHPVEPGFLIDQADIAAVDLKSLRTFLRDLDAAGTRPTRVQYTPPAA